LLLGVHPGGNVYFFAVVFGFAMGADYMLIPLMAAKQFGVNSLARAMAVILPVNTIGQTWVPLWVSFLREHFGSYGMPMNVVLGLAAIGAISILLLPRDTVGLSRGLPDRCRRGRRLARSQYQSGATGSWPACCNFALSAEYSQAWEHEFFVREALSPAIPHGPQWPWPSSFSQVLWHLF